MNFLRLLRLLNCFIICLFINGCSFDVQKRQNPTQVYQSYLQLLKSSASFDDISTLFTSDNKSFVGYANLDNNIKSQAIEMLKKEASCLDIKNIDEKISKKSAVLSISVENICMGNEPTKYSVILKMENGWKIQDIQH